MKKILILSFAIYIFAGCTDNFLKEVPYSFYTEANYYNNPSDFDKSLIGLYGKKRQLFFQDWGRSLIFSGYLGTDLVVASPVAGNANYAQLSNYTTEQDGNFSIFVNNWNNCYQIIKDANTILDNIDKPKWDSNEQKNRIEGNLKFFRAYFYFWLTQAYGNIPLITTPIREARTDFVRTPQPEILAQIVRDISDALQMLPESGNYRGEIDKYVAQHLLANVYLYMEDWKKAEELSSSVINSGKYRLMTERFGINMGNPGTPFTDLFFDGNMNRWEGNMETIWAWQATDYTKAGGEGHYLKAEWLNRYNMIPGMTSSVSNWQSGVQSLELTEHFLNDIFEFGDDRKSEYAIKTIWTFNDEEHIKKMKEQGTPLTQIVNGKTVEVSVGDTINILTLPAPYGQYLPPLLTKYMDIMPNRTVAEQNSDKDVYFMRLAETYLFRAEARFRQGNLSGAADDINLVRKRANASQVKASDINLDLILDERARELCGEENRRFTLLRTGKFIEMIKKHNKPASNNIQEKHKLWAIPQSEIDLMKDSQDFKQNTGYL